MFLNMLIALEQKDAEVIFKCKGSPQLLPGDTREVTICGTEFDLEASLIVLVSDSNLSRHCESKMTFLNFGTVGW